MKESRARQILQALVQGVDPLTGEELPTGTILQHADVLRALLAGVGALEQMAARAQRRAQLPGNVGRAWTAEEEQVLMTEFQRGETMAAIATDEVMKSLVGLRYSGFLLSEMRVK